MESNKEEALNLYAKIEDIIGIKEYAPKLYGYYYDILNNLKFNSLLDIGCGSGEFLSSLGKKYNNCYLFGIDKSQEMVKSSKKRGLNVANLNLKEIKEKFDIATATFDMVNYLNPSEIIEFFENLRRVVEDGGYFIFDLNSEFGLSDLAVGNFIAEDEKRFLAIESFYEGGLYESTFTLFEEVNGCYLKSKESIFQYYYSQEFISLIGGWKIDIALPIKLYDMEQYDKTIYLLRKV